MRRDKRLVVLVGLLTALGLVGAGPASASDGVPAPPGPSIAAGSLHTCAVTAGGTVLCWGFNDYGQLGDGTTTGRDEPTAVVGDGTGIAAVAPGDGHTCALTDDRAVRCWGDNQAGELGTGVAGYGTGSTVPVDVVGLDGGVAAVSAGHGYTCALTEAGGVRCWGGNSSGQLGNGLDEDSPVDPSSPIPVDVVGLDAGVAAIGTGQAHTCALTDDGGVRCWGGNYSGQLGNGTNTSSPVPDAVVGLDGVAAVTVGDQHTCALTDDGGVVCWGRNREGQLGNGTTTPSNVPVPVTGLGSGVVAISAGHYHTCALTDSGDVACWGSNVFGELGNGYEDDQPSETEDDHVTTPVDVVGPPGTVTQISAAGGHSCAMTETGEAWCWGDNYYGQIGDRTTHDRNVPSQVFALDLSGALDLSVGLGGTCRDDGATVVLTLRGGWAADVTLTATSSNQAVVRSGAIAFGGSGANRTVTLPVTAGRQGRTATVDLTAATASDTSTRRVTVQVGTTGDDVITGSSGADLIIGRSGDDRLSGRNGDDVLCGGNGNDTLIGGDHGDTLVGGDGRDDLVGGDHGDLLRGGDGDDTLRGQDGEDTLVGGNGDDDLRGGDDNDVLRGERGRDHLEGNNGSDHLYGGRHDDVLRGGDGSDEVYGGLGDDEIDGGRGADVFYGGQGADRFRGGPGIDAAYDFSTRQGDTKDRSAEYV